LLLRRLMLLLRLRLGDRLRSVGGGGTVLDRSCMNLCSTVCSRRISHIEGVSTPANKIR
tara:strand:+ start:220 stop:396 length:177 start_codon:yes stop_codon:yes gene_type:complete